jgi:deoxyadenosine/deoxycytidine kinase
MKFVIDGNIGAGKSTQLGMLERLGLFVKREPIHEWPLDLFYDDMSRWALTLQLAVMQTHQPTKEHWSTPVFYERSLLASRYVFWENMKQHDLVKAAEDVVHERAYEHYKWYPDVYIYLASDPIDNFRHIQSRDQAGDKGISLEYLESINSLYEKLLMSIPCRVHVVDTTGCTPDQVHVKILDILSQYTARSNGVYVCNARREKVQKTGSDGRPVLCTPFPDMCRLS